MSVLIKGMSYPELLSETITIMRDGRVFSYPCGLEIGEAVEIKEHGRLIDADALSIEMMDNDVDGVQGAYGREVNQIIADAPTVLEAEG